MTDSHVILLAFEVEADTAEAAQLVLLPQLQPVLASKGGPAECWWVADDERHDGSDLDSAVFVHPGAQALASQLLEAHHLTAHHNVVTRDRSRFEAPSCEWFARCGRPAVGHETHPILGPVPICARCQVLAQANEPECYDCGQPLRQAQEKAVGSGEVQTVWADQGGSWVCEGTGNEHRVSSMVLKEALSLAVFAINTWLHPDASSSTDVATLDDRGAEAASVLVQLRDRLR